MQLNNKNLYIHNSVIKKFTTNSSVSFLSLLKLRSFLADKHSFHIVTVSFWPILAAFSAFSFVIGLLGWMHGYSSSSGLILCGFFCLVCTMYIWWRDIVREATYLGYHTNAVQRGLRLGVILFIVSEVMFFFAFFWAFFHASFAPSPVLGGLWPPIGINTLNPLHIPLLNTLILLTSGFSVTFSHYAICIDRPLSAIYGLIITLILAIEFTLLQGLEYYSAFFYIFDGVYGSTFYVATGFHGFHVLVGSTFLLVCLFRLMYGHFLANHHLGLEAAIWYWHFVDVVWLFLYFALYCWGSGIF